MALLPSSPFISAAVESAEAPAVAFTCPQPEDATAACFDDISCIGEIFVGAAKLFEGPSRFVLDEQAFMDAIDEPPLFLRQAV